MFSTRVYTRINQYAVLSSRTQHADADDGIVCVPNPIVTDATLRYRTAAPGWINVTIYDAAGRRQVVLANHHEAAGTSALLWDRGSGRTCARPGVYWARLERDGAVVGRQKIVVLR